MRESEEGEMNLVENTKDTTINNRYGPVDPDVIDEKPWPIQSRSQMGFQKKERTHE